jgi:hypothetical protein
MVRRALTLLTAALGVPFASCLSAADPVPIGGERVLGRVFASGLVFAYSARALAASIDIEALADAERGSWPESEPGGVEPAALSVPALDPEQSLVAIAKETFVFPEPRWGKKKLGYLRAGAIVARKAEPASRAGCPGGWYAIEPEGYVCVGKSASLDLDHPIAKLSARRPDFEAPMPYVYGMSAFPTPPFYTRVPDRKQQQSVELDLDKHLSRKPGKSWDAVGLEPIPAPLADRRPLPSWHGAGHARSSLVTGRALVKSGFALLSTFESDGRRFGLSVDLDLLPLDRMQRVEPSKFHGLALDDDTSLPVVFVRSKSALLYEGSPATGLRPARPLAHREALPITGKRARVGSVAYLETKSGGWLRDEQLTRVDPIKNRPGWATPGRTWIGVSILAQSLVAYEGEKPVYVTLVSTGADGLGDPKETHSTVRGKFLIHTKHVTITMSGNEVGDEFDLREVPYVQYFNEGYALHAAYWHDGFGRPRSHGCINLSPIDARWLFQWTDPPIHERWHGAMSLREGTLIHIHP